MNRLLLPLAIVCFTLLTLPAAAEPEKLPPLELPVPAAMLKDPLKWAYGVYVNGGKSGWGVVSQSPSKWEGKEVLTYSMEVNMEIKALGNSMKMDMMMRDHYDATPPHRALLMEEIQKMDGQERHVTLRLKEGTTYSVEVEEAGKSRSVADVTCDMRFTHRTSLLVWAADPQRKPGDKAGSVEFDFDDLKLTSDTMTLLKETDWTGPGGKLPAWEVETYDFGHHAVLHGHVSRADGAPVNATFGQLFELRLEPEAVAKQKPGEQTDLFFAMSVKSDRKLGPATELTELELQLTPGDGAGALELPETVNQKAERADGATTLRITRGKAKPQPATAEDRAANLKATLRYPADNAEVKKLAAEAVGTATDDKEKVRKLLRYTDFFLRDSYEVEALSVMDLLKSRKGECSAHALLFTTFARAAGIPAREAGGWYYMGDSYQAFGGHAWNEVILDGHWVPVDAIFQQMQLDAGHIQLSSGEMDGKSLAGMTPGIRAKVKSVARE
jgi:hypothetical protein